jgi:phosphoribosylformimino-5-aminoimidazole carboxamide ribotide isomerase
MAQNWVRQGAECLHLVDLDGARDGQTANERAVEAILSAVDVPCELGGGIRDETVIRRWLEAGLQRLVVGTRALKEPGWFRQMCRLFPSRLVLGIDARDGRVATDGWIEVSSIEAVELARSFDNEPLAAIIYTDIAKDGMLAGPNVEAMDEMNRAVTTPVIASGGVTTVEDVKRLAQTRVAGCIIGRSLYEGTLSLSAAIQAARN